MIFFNFGVIFLLQTIVINFANAGSITIDGVNINWTYGSTSTTFTVTSTLGAGQPGQSISACIVLMDFIAMLIYVILNHYLFIS
jgi:hypothetical protein